jgi:HK97 family phage prohead protease
MPRAGGYAALFGIESRDLGGFREVVENRAFAKTLADKTNVLCRWEHDVVLGTTAANTLRLDVDARGLSYEVDLADTQAGRDAATMIGRGDYRSSSFAFLKYEDSWEYRGYDGVPVRHLVSVRLIDVSPTANPAYPQAECALRSFAAQFDADVDEVRLDFKNGNTARYFSMADETRTVVIDLAPSPSVPTLEVAEQRGEGMNPKQAALQLESLRYDPAQRESLNARHAAAHTRAVAAPNQDG